MYNHLIEVGKCRETLKYVDAGQGFISQELKAIERGAVRGRKEEVKSLLVLVAQQILLVPNVIFAGQTELLQLAKIEACKRL